MVLNLPIVALWIGIAFAESLSLSQHQQQLLHDRLFQTNLRGPRWTGNDNQNTLTELVAGSMRVAGLEVKTLTYELDRWDPRWWSLTLKLKNGTVLGLPTTGYWPYSGDSGLGGVTKPVHDAGSFKVIDDLARTADVDSLDLSHLSSGGAIVFFDNPSPTRNYSLPEYRLLGTSRDIPASSIPELGNLTNPHWQSAKALNFTDLKAKGVDAVIASWVDTSDEDAALQYLPNRGAPGNGNHYDVPALYVGNSTGELIRGLVKDGEVDTATVVLDAPSYKSNSSTVIGHLKGTGNTEHTIILYTHSDGPSIIEENGPILLLTMAEVLAQHRPNINIDFVITTGHVSGGHLNESLWMDEESSMIANAKAIVACEHFGAIEWKDDLDDGKPVYKPTGLMEPMWTMANDSALSDLLHELYLESFEDTSDSVRMALVAPQRIKGKLSKWYGVGGAAHFGHSKTPTIGIIPQPDYLWASMVDGGWSKLDIPTAIEQINVILKLIDKLDTKPDVMLDANKQNRVGDHGDIVILFGSAPACGADIRGLLSTND
ncbi:translation elongation factor 2 [Paramarasmius palmivorus]|uniref:Translation elongation factor 2 n=1 Tax=Paramarasmius palmivorus TaxID=297713 RepID=A0AAW0EGV7_9AGAR